MTTLPLRERIARAGSLGVCEDCKLDRDQTLEAADTRDEYGAWRGGMYLNLLLTCARNCESFPEWAKAVTA